VAETARATLGDVAAVAGLSLLRTSEALHGRVRLPGPVALRLSRAVEKLGYRTPGTVRATHPAAVRIVVPNLTSWFYSQAASVAQEVLEHHGIHSTIVGLHQELGQETAPGSGAGRISPLLTRNVHGVLLMGLDLTGTEARALLDSGVAVAGLGQPSEDWDSVGIDDEFAAWSAAQHLLELGHWNLALLAGTDATMVQRRRGFLQALAEHDLEAEPDFIVSTATSLEGGYAAMNDLIAERGRPSAVVAACDDIAFGALKALHEHGLDVPESLSLVGIDDHPMSSLLGLSTVSQSVPDQAALAASLLAERVLAAPGRVPPEHHLLPTTLLARKSTRRARSPFWAGAARGGHAAIGTE